MATIIDALLVTLGLDAAGMIKGAKDTKDALKDIEEESKRASDQFQKQQQEEAEAFKKRQRTQADAFEKQQKTDLAKSKTTREASQEATKQFRRNQADEAGAFKRSQSDKSAVFKKNWADRVKAAKEEHSLQKQNSEAADAFKGELLAAFAVLGGINAIKDFGEKLIDTNTQIGRTSQSLGVSAVELNKWQMAAERAGVSADEISNAFRTSNQFQADLATGGEDAIKKLNEFASIIAGFRGKNGQSVDVNWARFSDKNLTSQERLIELSKVLSQLSDKDATLAAAKLGYAEDTARFLHEGADAVEKQLKAAGEIDPAFESAAKHSQILSQEWIELKQNIKGAGDAILDWMYPALKACEDVVSEFFKDLKNIASGKIEGNFTDVSHIQYDAMGNATGIENSDEDDSKAPSSKPSASAVPIAAPIATTPQSRDIDFGEDTTSTPSANAKQAAADTAKTAGAAGLSYDLTKGVPQAVIDAALKSQEKYNVPAAVTIAQWRLESSNGAKMPEGSNNPFGIKAKAGQPFVEAMTTEVKNGVEMRVMQKFARFDSLDDAFEQHAKLLATSKYYKKAREHAEDPDAYADELTGVYATDPNYGSKLKKMMAGSNASAMPVGAAMAANASNTSTQSNSTTSVQTTVGNVTVNAPNAKTNADVATAIKDKLSTYTYAANANVGLQ